MNITFNSIDKEAANIIVDRITRSNTTIGLFKLPMPGHGYGFEIITPSKAKGFYISASCEDYYVGTYTSGVTPQQIIDDWS